MKSYEQGRKFECVNGVPTLDNLTNLDWMPFNDNITEITAHRQPTAAEIRFGYGATHYKTFPVEVWQHPNGKPKAWIKCQHDGLRYYR